MKKLSFLLTLLITLLFSSTSYVGGTFKHLRKTPDDDNIKVDDSIKEAPNAVNNSKLKFAWVTGKLNITLILKEAGELPLEKLKITTHLETQLSIEDLKQNGDKIFIQISPETPIDFDQNISVTLEGDRVYAHPTKGILNQYFFYSKELGAIYRHGDVELVIWSPTATKMEVLFFDPANPNKLIGSRSLLRRAHGIWQLIQKASDLGLNVLHGVPYILKVSAFGQTKFALDPYAKSLTGFNGNFRQLVKGVIIDLSRTDPPHFDKDTYSNRTALKNPLHYMGYEVHVRDFTIDPHYDLIPPQERGTYLGLKRVAPYIQELGISHVQLMPIQSFYTTNEFDRSFQDENRPKSEINYNWGYDAHHYFAPEGWYSTNPNDPAARIRELKEMVQTFHLHGIGLVVDVVYNHVFDGDLFERIAPGCYLRRNAHGDVSLKTGAGSSVESRIKMVRRLIVDSLKYFQDEFHINGFRFDLMGFLDHASMAKIRQTLGEDAILYGEAWEFTDLPPSTATTKSNLPPQLSLGAFNDSSRDAYTGRMRDQGFIQGAFHEGPRVLTGIIGGIKNYSADYDDDGIPDVPISQDAYHRFARSPINTINYLTIHDGFTLWDKINLSINATQEERKALVKLALGMVLTSQGRVVLHGGIEMGRSKPLATNDPNADRAHTSEHINPEGGVTHFHENSYSSPDVTNMVNWERAVHFKDVKEYLKGLTTLRKYIPSLTYTTAGQIQEGLHFVTDRLPVLIERSQRIVVNPKGLDELDHLTMEFINGPPDSRYYVVGEVHPRDHHNPPLNPYHVEFNQDGHASLTFNKDQIARFDFKGWSDPHGLQLKLVKTPGEWDTPVGSYTTYGNNTILASSLKTGNIATINLAIVDHTAGHHEIDYQSYIAYFLDNSVIDDLDENFPYAKMLVIHNAADGYIEIEIQELLNYSRRDILVDSRHAGIKPIKNSSVILTPRTVRVPKKSTAVIGLQ